MDYIGDGGEESISFDFFEGLGDRFCAKGTPYLFEGVKFGGCSILYEIYVGEAALALSLSKYCRWIGIPEDAKVKAQWLELTSPSNLSILKLRLLILSCGDEGKHTRQFASEYITSKKYWAAIPGDFDRRFRSRSSRRRFS